MASLKYRIKGSSKDVTIYVRFSVSRESIFEVKTGFSIDPTNWSSTTNLPKQNSAATKLLYNNLKKLESTIFESLNNSQANGKILNREWLEQTIASCFEREVKKTSAYYLTDHIQYIIDNASTRKIAGQNRLGLSGARIQSYKSFKKNIEEFEKTIKTQLKLIDLSFTLIEKYKIWLLNKKKFSINYAGKQLDNLRAVGKDALRMDIATNPYVNQMDSFCESDEDRYIVTLSNDELLKIKQTEMPTSYLVNAKKWLLLGCEIGQRGGDLLNLTKENLRYVDEHLFIDVVQQKTKKEVTIPIGSKEIQFMLENEFPRPISTQNLNSYIKKVCEISGIDEEIEGRLLDVKTNRKVQGKYPKYKLVTSHTFRRSFSSNYYKKIATPILMTITGHSKESMFLKYINKQEDKDENAKLFLQYYHQLNR
jgi:integrase